MLSVAAECQGISAAMQVAVNNAVWLLLGCEAVL